MKTALRVLLASVAAMTLMLPGVVTAQQQEEDEAVQVISGRASGGEVSRADGIELNAWDVCEKIGTTTIDTDGEYTLRLRKSDGPVSFTVGRWILARETYDKWEAGATTTNFDLHFYEGFLPESWPSVSDCLSESTHTFSGAAFLDNNRGKIEPAPAGTIITARTKSAERPGEIVGMARVRENGEYTIEVTSTKEPFYFWMNHYPTFQGRPDWEAGQHTKDFTLTLAPWREGQSFSNFMGSILMTQCGPPGPRGLDGEQGPQGPQGEQGPKGEAGATGEQGPAGRKGPVGTPGERGPTGLAGPVGPQGPPGYAGADGPAGPAGQWGPKGTEGTQGPPGEYPLGLFPLVLAAVAAVVAGSVPYSIHKFRSNRDASKNYRPPPPTANGPIRASIPMLFMVLGFMSAAIVAPTIASAQGESIIGKANDKSRVTEQPSGVSESVHYLPVAWTALETNASPRRHNWRYSSHTTLSLGPASPNDGPSESLKARVDQHGICGAAGPEGFQGKEGPQGDAGARGEPGASGPQGPPGPAGPAGARGPAGLGGPTGLKGEQGPPGLAGETGADGPAGPVGPRGFPGPAGKIGSTGSEALGFAAMAVAILALITAIMTSYLFFRKSS